METETYSFINGTLFNYLKFKFVFQIICLFLRFKVPISIPIRAIISIYSNNPVYTRFKKSVNFNINLEQTKQGTKDVIHQQNRV